MGKGRNLYIVNQVEGYLNRAGIAGDYLTAILRQHGAYSSLHPVSTSSSTSSPKRADSLAAWIAASTTIPNCVIQAFVSDMSDILGRTPFLLVGMVFGVAGSLLSSRATTLIMVIGGQVLNGCGLTLGYLSIPLFTEVVPKDKRPAIQGFSGIAAGTASLLGPVIQGVFIERQLGGQLGGWRVGFYL
ncbi:hypothetical protein ACJZ2D_007119 [Fusarium nematophilum]